MVCRIPASVSVFWSGLKQKDQLSAQAHRLVRTIKVLMFQSLKEGNAFKDTGPLTNSVIYPLLCSCLKTGTRLGVARPPPLPASLRKGWLRILSYCSHRNGEDAKHILFLAVLKQSPLTLHLPRRTAYRSGALLTQEHEAAAWCIFCQWEMCKAEPPLLSAGVQTVRADWKSEVAAVD